MNIKSQNASMPIMYALTAGVGLGMAYGAIKSFNLGRTAQILTFGTIVLILWLIFRQGKASSYATAQAWAQNQVDIALEVCNIATAKANALSQSYSLAISQANATATNSIYLPNSQTGEYALINSEGEKSAELSTQGFGVSMDKLEPKELASLWQSADFKNGLYLALQEWAKNGGDLGSNEVHVPDGVRGLLSENSESTGGVARKDIFIG